VCPLRMRSEKFKAIAVSIAFFLGVMALITIWVFRIRGIMSWFK
jgi:hypothetical protein